MPSISVRVRGPRGKFDQSSSWPVRQNADIAVESNGSPHTNHRRNLYVQGPKLAAITHRIVCGK